jgi:hypothetical protein
MKRAVCILSAALLVTGTAAKAYDVELMFCALQDSGKMVSIRMDGPDVTYAFGDLNVMSDLILTTPVADIDYQPWPGVGNTIWETITFYNGDYGYSVVMGVERVNNPAKYGGITITKNGIEIANLDCLPSSVSFEVVNPLYDAKTEAGWCVDRSAKGGWTRCD